MVVHIIRLPDGLPPGCATGQAGRNAMSKLRVQNFGISIDGYGAGPNQDLQNPLGVRGPELMEWFFHTRVWRRMHVFLRKRA